MENVEYIPQKALPIIHLLRYDAFKCFKFVLLPIRIILYKPRYPETSGKLHEPWLHHYQQNRIKSQPPEKSVIVSR